MRARALVLLAAVVCSSRAAPGPDASSAPDRGAAAAWPRLPEEDAAALPHS